MKQISEVETITSSRPALSGWICWGAAAPFVMALLLSFQVGAMKPLSCTIHAGAFQDAPAPGHFPPYFAAARGRRFPTCGDRSPRVMGSRGPRPARHLPRGTRTGPLASRNHATVMSEQRRAVVDFYDRHPINEAQILAALR